MDIAPQLPVAADWFSLTWVTGRTAVLTEPHVDELLRAGLWYLRGRDRDLLVDTGNGVGALAPVLARLARGGRPREIVCVCTHAHIDHIGGFQEFERRCTPPKKRWRPPSATVRRWRRRCGRGRSSISSPTAASCPPSSSTPCRTPASTR